MKEFLLFFFVLILLICLASASSVEISLNLDKTRVDWDEIINASGYAKNSSTGGPWSGTIKIFLDSKEVCSATSDSNGFFNCTFSSREIGEHLVQAYALSDSSIIGKSDEKKISIYFGYGNEKTYGSVASLVFPMLIQQVSGNVSLVFVNLKVW